MPNKVWRMWVPVSSADLVGRIEHLADHPDMGRVVP